MTPNNPTNPTKAAREWLAWIQYKTTPAQLDRMIDRVALETESALKAATPKKWFGQVRNGWKIQKPGTGQRVLINTATANGVPIMLFLEEGTANNGTGYIYPKQSKNLYVPLTKRAASGWRAGIKWGVDFVLKKRVRGMKGQHIVRDERPKAMERLKAGMKDVIRQVLRKEGFSASL